MSHLLIRLRVWRQFGADARNFLLITFWVGVSIGVGTVLLNLYLVQLGYSTSFIGFLFVNAAAAAGLTAVPAGRAADVWGRRPLLFAGGVCAGIGQIMLLLWPTPTVLTASSWLSGIGGATLAIVAAPLLYDYAPPPLRTTVFSWNFAIGTLAAVIGNVLGGWLPVWLSTFYGVEADSVTAYRGSIWIGLFIAALAGWPLLRLREPVQSLKSFKGTESGERNRNGKQPSYKRQSLKGGFEQRRTTISRSTAGEGSDALQRGVVLPYVKRWLAHPVRSWQEAKMSSRTIPWLLVVPYGLTGLGAGLFIPYLNLFFAQQLGARTEQIGFIFAIEAIATGMAGFAAPYLGRKFGNVQGVAYARLAAIPFLFLMAHIPFLWVVAAAAWLRNVLANSASPLLTNFAMDLAPYETRGTLNSFLNISYQAGWALSAGLGGWIIQHFHYIISFYFAALLFAAANVFLYVTFQPWDR